MPEHISDAHGFHSREAALDAVAKRKAKSASIAQQIVTAKKTAPPQLVAAEQTLRTEREILASLIEKQATTQLDVEAKLRERSKIAYSAIAGDDKTAKARLEQLHVEIGYHDSIVASLEAAVAEAHVRITAAEEAQRTAEGGQNASQALELLALLRSHGEQLDGAAQALMDSYRRLRDVLRQLRALGFSHPAERLTAAASRRALQASLAQSDLEFGDLLRPAEKHTFKEITAGWAAGIETQAHSRMNGKG